MLIRKLFRTAWKYKAQFLSMIVMVTIGMGIFFGFNMEWYSLQKDVTYFLEETNYADYRAYTSGGAGFSEEDVASVKAIEGVDEATRVLAVTVGLSGEEDKSLSLFCPEEYTVSTMLVMGKGEEYSAEKEGFWLSDKFAAANGISVGDTLTLSYSGAVELSGSVLGLIKSGEYLVCVSDGLQVMPDYTAFGFAYCSPAFLFREIGAEYYPQINLISSLSKEEITERIDGALSQTTLVLSKEEHASYAGALSEIEEGQAMGSILPVLFLLIGILTMVTTMHRITANEKTQIGTLKALGFRDKRIVMHYTLYGLFFGLVGCLMGIGLGYGIAAAVVNPSIMEGTYFDMPVWKLYVPWFCWVVMAAAVAFLTLIGFLSVRKMLRGTAADALRPYTPKRVKPLALEKTALWNRLSFSVKWNLRDVLRHKSRSLMTLIGVLGCTVLIVGAVGMNDTMTAFLDVLETKVYTYETRVNFTDTATEEDIRSFAAEYSADLLSETTVKWNGGAVALEIYKVGYGNIGFVDSRYRSVSLGDEGVYVCSRIAEQLEGDELEFSPYGSNAVYRVHVAGVLCSFITENIVMTEAYASEIGFEYSFNAAFTAVPKAEIAQEDFISTTPSKQTVLDSYDEFIEILNVMVLMLIVAAFVLGFFVLYSLGVMSYMERYRELATLKVVGFKDRRIGRILIEQNLWLTVLGVLAGVPAGAGVMAVLLKKLAGEYELKLVLGALTYVAGILLPLCISLLVGIFVARKNRKINMVESLKGAE